MHEQGEMCDALPAVLVTRLVSVEESPHQTQKGEGTLVQVA